MKKWLKIVGIIVLSVLGIVFIWEFIYLKSTTVKEVYILPQNFNGIVIVAYDRADGLEEEKEEIHSSTEYLKADC